jgi:hypothetical protein
MIRGEGIMKTLTRLYWLRRRQLLVMLVALGISMGAQAQVWSCIQGTSGHIEYEGNIQPASRTRPGWGLDFEAKPGVSNWVQFAIPTVYPSYVRYVGMLFKTGSPDAWIDEVHVYNLNNKVVEFVDLDWSGDYQVQLLDMGEPPIPSAALNVSIRIAAGVEMMSHKFVFSAVCAGFVPAP